MEVTATVPIQWKQMIQAEYREMPGLSLTKPQMRRFWGLDEVTCNVIVEALEQDHFLKRTPANAYVIAPGAN